MDDIKSRLERLGFIYCWDTPDLVGLVFINGRYKITVNRFKIIGSRGAQDGLIATAMRLASETQDIYV